MSTDNKQTQEMYYHNKHRHCFIVEDGHETLAATVYGSDAELYGTLLTEAFNTKALTGKGPKELWEELKIEKGISLTYRKTIDDYLQENKQLSERVKELKGVLSNQNIFLLDILKHGLFGHTQGDILRRQTEIEKALNK